MGCALTKNDFKVFIKTKFDSKSKNSFNKFDATERLEIIEEYLDQEIDFDYYVASGIIEAHFPLHSKNEVKHIQESFDNYKTKLLLGFIGGNW